MLDNPIDSPESLDEDTYKADSTEKDQNNINVIQIETETYNQTLLSNNSFTSQDEESEKEIVEGKKLKRETLHVSNKNMEKHFSEEENKKNRLKRKQIVLSESESETKKDIKRNSKSIVF